MLNLPSTYAARTKVDGNLKDGRFVELRRMASPTGGHLQVWAARFSGQDWTEITGEMFTIYASEIIGANYGKMAREIEKAVAGYDAMKGVVQAAKEHDENPDDYNAWIKLLQALNDYESIEASNPSAINLPVS